MTGSIAFRLNGYAFDVHPQYMGSNGMPGFMMGDYVTINGHGFHLWEIGKQHRNLVEAARRSN